MHDKKPRGRPRQQRDVDGLLPRERAFICTYVQGDKTVEQAALEAGYPKASARVRGTEILGNDNCLKVLQVERRKLYSRDAVQARKVLRELMDDTSLAATVRKDCARDLVQLSGDKVDRVEITQDQPSPEQVQDRIRELKAKHGLSLVKPDKTDFETGTG